MQIFVRDRSFYKKLITIALPISLQSLITIGVNMMDNIMLGRLGEVAMSAASQANQVFSLFQIFCMGMGMGASVLISRYYGMQDIFSLKKSVTIMYRLLLCLGLLFTVAAIVAPGFLMSLYTNEDAVIYEGIRYYRWSIPCFLLQGLSLTTTIVLRSIGKVHIPLYTSIGAFFLNVAANYVFIFGKFGAPEMGVAGAALGTLISRTFEFAVICGYFRLKENEVGYRIKDFFCHCGDIWVDYIRICIPVLISDGLLGFGNTAVAMVYGRLGSNFVSANSIAAVTMQLTTVLIQGMSNASAIITGHTLGEGKVRQAQEQGYTFLALGAIFGLVAAGIIVVIAEPVIGFYKITEETRGIAFQLMDAVAVIVFFQAMNSILTKGVLRGGGDTKFLMVADILFLWVVSIPLGCLAGFVWDFPAFWIYFCIRIDQVIKAVWCVWRLKSGKWIKKIDSHLEEA